MSLSNVKYPQQCTKGKVGFESQDVTSVVTGESFDRLDRAEGAPQSVLLVCTGDITTAGGAAGDKVDVTLAVVTGATSSPATELVSKTIELTVDDDNEKKAFACFLEVPIHDAEQYVAGQVTVAAGEGAPTLSSANAGLAYVFGSLMKSSLQDSDSVEGYGEAVTA